MSNLRVAALQLDFPASESAGQRLDRVLTELASAPPADLVVLPELWDVGYFSFDDYEKFAHDLLQDRYKELRDSALARGFTLVAGSMLERAGEAIHNTVVVIDPNGKLVGTYRKSHLFGYGSRESELLTKGGNYTVTKSRAGKLGLAVCFDLRFPDQFGWLRQQGADLFVVPAAWPSERESHWKILLQARAIEHQTPLVACNGTGICNGVELAGSSMIIDSRGEILAEAGQEAGWITGTIDTAVTEEWRHQFPISEVASP